MQGLQHNLLSISQFCDKGYGDLFDKDRCQILHKKNGLLALQGVNNGNLFIADLQSGSKDEVNCFYFKASSDESWLWHKKLSHLNFKIMNSLVKRELMRGLPQMEFTQEGLYEALLGPGMFVEGGLNTNYTVLSNLFGSFDFNRGTN